MPTHFGLPLTIAQWSLVVQTLPSSHAVPVGAAAVPGMHWPLLLQLSFVVHGLPSHSRAPGDGMPPPQWVTMLPAESFPSEMHCSFFVQALWSSQPVPAFL